MNPYVLPEGNVQIAFSGGRTSAYLLRQILDANDGLPDRARVVFCNTGREMPQTLDFVAEVGDRWGVPIVWLEYLPETPGFQLVSHNSAAREGEPFEALIRKRKFLPNVMARFCTQEMKVRPVSKYLMSLGWERWSVAVGIRADEPNRLNPKPSKERFTVWHPLADAGVSRRDVSAFWRRQQFDLRLPNVGGNCWLGNCDGCFLKSEAHVAAFTRDYPERAQWWERMEALATDLSKAKGMTPERGAWFSKRYTRAELRDFIERQGDMVFSTEGMLCQADDGECTA